jgi:hypothetical protein
MGSRIFLRPQRCSRSYAGRTRIRCISSECLQDQVLPKVALSVAVLRLPLVMPVKWELHIRE